MDKKTVSLRSYLPEFLLNYREINEILSAEEPEFQALSDASVDVLDACFLDSTSDELISKYETLIGIEPQPTETIEMRRNRLKAMFDGIPPFTINKLKKRIEEYQGNNDVSIYYDESDPYLLHVVTGYYDQWALENIPEMVRQMVPASLNVDVHSRMEEDNEIYGIEMDMVEQTITRLAGAVGLDSGSDFDSISPWGGRYRCILTDDGVEAAKYGDAAYSETGFLTTAVTLDGITYPVGTQVQVMVKQPKFYYYIVPMITKNRINRSGIQCTKYRCYISPYPKEGFKLHPLFKNGESENDFVYLSAYETTFFDVGENTYVADNSQTWWNTDKMSSIAGVLPFKQNASRANVIRMNIDGHRTLAANRGIGWKQGTVQGSSASQLLFLIEYAAFRSHEEIGEASTGNTWHVTGMTSSLGNASGAVTVDGVTSISYRGEENLWGNLWNFRDGVNIIYNSTTKNYEIYVCEDFDFESFKTDGNYSQFTDDLHQVSGKISAFFYVEKFDWLFIPCRVMGAGSGDGAFDTGYVFSGSTIGGTTYPSYFSTGKDYRSVGNKADLFATGLGITLSFDNTCSRLTYIPNSAN